MLKQKLNADEGCSRVSRVNVWPVHLVKGWHGSRGNYIRQEHREVNLVTLLPGLFKGTGMVSLIWVDALLVQADCHVLNTTCKMEGRVVVTITVNPAGVVINTSINRLTNTVNPVLEKQPKMLQRKPASTPLTGLIIKQHHYLLLQFEINHY